MLRIFKVRDYFKREGKVGSDSFFSKLPYLSILFMSDLKLTSCNFYDKMDGIRYTGQYDQYITTYIRGAIFK